MDEWEGRIFLFSYELKWIKSVIPVYLDKNYSSDINFLCVCLIQCSCTKKCSDRAAVREIHLLIIDLEKCPKRVDVKDEQNIFLSDVVHTTFSAWFLALVNCWAVLDLLNIYIYSDPIVWLQWFNCMPYICKDKINDADSRTHDELHLFCSRNYEVKVHRHA